ncbi:acyltransferase [Cytophagaceae bacterium YF14B1]|uniref:Acyltransferase n=1 Tax=Xanthocytophaga flava TaxID=3048013 RepID=A0AAE3QRX9_9BACT|nr:acyltransferase [Xanthocytophaga flavus]MDJ1482405.1 acyltransferase [Xanthocytophaga flavus]
MKSKIVYLPGLNGLRALAAISVVLSHITLSLGGFGLNPHILGTSTDGAPKGLLLAGFGVSIFFALSGFLITYLLLLEKEKQQINITHFYLRRILRIWPLYYTYLTICVVVYLLYNISFDRTSTLYYLFFASNIAFILNHMLPFLAHFWSIGVEEQFYLFYPWLIRKNTNLFLLLSFITVILITLKLIFWILEKKTGMSLPLLFLHVNRFHCMLIGGIGAILYYQSNNYFITICTHKISQGICWFILFLVSINMFHIASVLDNEIISLVTTIIIVGQITKKNYIINLENTVLDFLGRISYGIYVIHPIIIFLVSQLIPKNFLPTIFLYVFLYLAITILTILIAYISYEFFEKQFLKIKNKFSTIPSSSNNPYHSENFSKT